MKSEIKPEVKPEEKPEKKSDLKIRVLASIVLIAVVVLILIAPTLIMRFAIAVCAVIGIYEFFGAVRLRTRSPLMCVLGCIGAAIVPFLGMLSAELALACAFLYLALSFFLMIISRKRIQINDIAMMLMGIIYVSFMFSHILFIKQLEYGSLLVWLVFLGACTTDTAAYFVGRSLGRHKLCPTISPKKTVEGAVGGVVCCGLIFLIFALVVNLGGFLGNAEMSYPLMFAMGITVSVMSQIGDLTASVIKRQYGIKDFGNLIPGHGGLLDRCDSIIMAAPTIFIFVSLTPIIF